MESPRFVRGEDDEDDCETFESEPVYIMERDPGRSKRDPKRDDQYDSFSSSDGSSFFSNPSMDTYQTNQTFVTNVGDDPDTDPFFSSIFTNMLRCGASLNHMGRSDVGRSHSSTQRQKAAASLTPHEQNVYKAWKNSNIVVDTNHGDNRGDKAGIIRSPRDPTTTPRLSSKAKGSKRESMTPKSTVRFETEETRDAAAESDERNLESGSSEMYNSTSHSSEDDGQRKSRGMKSVKWRKALGLKPSRPKRRNVYESRIGPESKNIQERTMVLEQTSSGLDNTYQL